MTEFCFEHGFFSLKDAAPARSLEATPEDIEAVRNWAQRYDRAVIARDEAAFLSIGRDIGDWLDRHGFERLTNGDWRVVFVTSERPVPFSAP